MNEFINLGWTKDEIAKKIADEFPHGSYVNLGIGMPELVSKFVDESKEIICLLYTSPSPRDFQVSRMPSSA